MSCESYTSTKKLWEDWDFSFIYKDANDQNVVLTWYSYEFIILDQNDQTVYNPTWSASAWDDEILIKIPWSMTTTYSEWKMRYQWKVTSNTDVSDLTDIWEFWAIKSLFSS